MKLDFHFWLKRAIGRLFEPTGREPVNASFSGENGLFSRGNGFSRDEERDRFAREYELHYWGATPGLWY
ncbi:hypothetical protein Rleg4DRAFT_4793 [Rhizobium leguminosarum bv. trifolii WSM2297]|uniref:Uncharacterized protein n=1 Tax=Rhizobium leguminosarum bv. trifolii WSM2297 TaxID=754762 RepID=J0CTA1_RHILT|nr:hypothetical protein [Rhizobium leguminosarum]EJC83055.1 hypothetical protein Rleg4DRAFT_4793 [Rhizobium leguminosarum bv. trifolii WSM2297]